MKLKVLAAAALIAVAGSAMAKTENLGLLSSDTTEFSNSFLGSGSFSDTYNFTLGGSGSAYGGITTFSFLSNIKLSSLSLTGGNIATTLTDLTPGAFSFGNLIAGSYSLVLTGSTFGIASGYRGTIETNAVAAPVPEPESLMMMGLGMGVLAFVARRRKQAAK